MHFMLSKERDHLHYKALLRPIPILEPWESVAAYCMRPLLVTTLGNRYIAVTGYLFTKFLESVALLSIEANIITQIFLDNAIF